MHVRVVVDVDSPCGGVADGVLGCAAAGEITLVAGWAWYSEADAALIEFGEYDFQTIVTHELGHAVGLDHSGDEDSVMYEALADGEFRRNITEWDLTLLREGGDGDPSPLLARPRHRPTAESVTPELPPRCGGTGRRRLVAPCPVDTRSCRADFAGNRCDRIAAGSGRPGFSSTGRVAVARCRSR